ncbi:MAG: fimbrillin family protein [Muribaculaceae bacterium]|nr:fimbrillin family protein [Muribaculaceae bacterium]
MKKSIYLIAVSALALSACTSEEVIFEGKQSNVIGFQNVVDKQSRSTATEVTASNLNHFSVFGYYTNPNVSTQAILVFNNELVTKGDKNGQTVWNYDNTRYWVPNATYCFYAYSCGDIKLNSQFGHFTMDVTKSLANDRVLKIEDYVCDETHQHDLLYAAKEGVKPETDETGQKVVSGTDVAFKFDHLLAKIDTKFRSSFAPEYTVEIKNITASNIRNVGSYDPKNNGWNNTPKRVAMEDGKDPYVVLHEGTPIVAQKGGVVTDVAGNSTTITELTPTSDFAFVLPYAYTGGDVKLSFEMTLKKDGEVILSRVLSGSWSPTWQPGHWYTYTIDITGDATNLTPIMFTTETDPISGWSTGETPSDITFSAN